MTTLQRFLVWIFLGAINHQVTYILAEGGIFEPQRGWVEKRNAWLGQFVRCELCMGTWVGLWMALVFRPGLVPVPRVATWGSRANAMFIGVVSFFADAFLIAFLGRVFNELLAISRKEVAVKEEAAEFLDQVEREVEQGQLRIVDG